ncbi:hypothetical protein [Nocardia seriolae]|uniref:Membrane protein n=1 Tax=Nocardia seriolae TaxID=37332 RepID=A0ABC9Z433_9NOCA|nr:hypothetical protein [Nocardia seriolae]APB00936.1 hypothetical protein NS506_06907 [Nocardia seriolae]OJF82210.1 hypothetical protein NS14008_27485 [Nocardia seriolae]PSK27449.1 hypothetical protein C6575_31745 [Nocardia seriolae]QOW33688.1 DUF1542 domain-containing protein [Nocardia seriolae]QUN14808.1 DUF1542 domain-containing protein [Nocardia seriolae]
MATVVVLLIVMVVVLLAVVAVNRAQRSRSNTQLEDAKADARRVIERLGGQVYNLDGTDAASKQALADAGERFNAAGSQIEQASTPAQARLAKETALEGLYYVSAARTAMGMDPGPAVPELDGQRSAGRVTEDRAIDFDGRRVEASPTPSAATPNYYPGGRVAGRPVPAGWYSEPWWKTALVAGAWGVGSAVLFNALFSGMSGIGYDTTAFENGYGDGYQAGLDAADGGYDGGGNDQGGYDPGYDQGGYDQGGIDPGADLGGQDFGDYGDFGGFDGFDGDF